MYLELNSIAVCMNTQIMHHYYEFILYIFAYLSFGKIILQVII